MKATSTQNDAANNQFSIRRMLTLFIVCLLAPGCMNNTEQCNSRISGTCLPKSGLLLFADNTVTTAVSQVHDLVVIAFTGEYVAITGDVTKTTDGVRTDRNTPMDRPKPLLAVDAEHYVDPHNTNVDDKLITITLPAIMRIAIMVFLVIIMV